MFRRSGRSYGNATQTIPNDPDDWDDLDRLERVEFYPDDGDDLVNFEGIIWKRAQTTETIRTIIPVIENNFGPDGAEATKVIHKCSQCVWGLFEIGESPWNQVFEEILCLRGTLLVSQCRKIKRKSRYQVTRFTLRIKIIHLCGLFAKHARKNSIVWPRDIADDPASLAFEAIEKIILKLAIVSVLRIVSKYFETTGAIGTIRTIIWKPGLTSFTPEALTGCQNLNALQKSTYVTHLAN